MTRYPADDPVADFGDNALVGKVRTLDEIAVSRIAIERRATRDERRDRRTVGTDRRAKTQRGLRRRFSIQIGLRGQGHIVLLPI
jgi:hypothetical protein